MRRSAQLAPSRYNPETSPYPWWVPGSSRHNDWATSYFLGGEGTWNDGSCEDTHHCFCHSNAEPVVWGSLKAKPSLAVGDCETGTQGWHTATYDVTGHDIPRDLSAYRLKVHGHDDHPAETCVVGVDGNAATVGVRRSRAREVTRSSSTLGRDDDHPRGDARRLSR